MLQTNQQVLLDLTASALFGYPYKIGEYAENDPLSDELLAQAVLPVALSGAGDTARIPARWKARANQVVAANMAVSYEHTELHDLLTANGIPYVVLKGAASASYYPTPILRTMGDVDFLIHEDAIQRTSQLLAEIGFQMEPDTGGIHIACHRGTSTWEMHRSVNGIPAGEAGAAIQAFLSDVIETAVDYDEGNGILRILDHFHHGLILLLHTASHLTSEGVGLRHLCDWAVFVNHFSDGQFTELFEDKLKACGLWRFAQLLTLVCVRYLHLPVREWAGQADGELLERMICDILHGGNFGKKEEDRYRQIKYISNRGEHTVDEKSTLLQLWDTVSKKAEMEQKTRAAVLADYARLVMQGKRRLDSGATLRRAGERKSLYAEFRLFER